MSKVKLLKYLVRIVLIIVKFPLCLLYIVLLAPIRLMAALESWAFDQKIYVDRYEGE